MAQKKGFIYRITMGKDNLPDFTPDKLPGNRFSQFSDVFFGRIGAMVKINLLVLLFALPLLVIIALGYLNKMVIGSMIPYAGNFGIGHPVITNAAEIGEAHNFLLDFQTNLFMLPFIVLLFIGLSGAFYVMRRLVWAEGVGIASHFFNGIKMNFKPFLLSSFFLAISFFLAMFNITAYNTLEVHAAIKIIGLAITIIIFLILVCMTLFLTTQAVTYKLKFWPLVKNSFLFAIGLLIPNLFILLLSVLPFILLALLLSVQFIGMLLLMVVLMLGFSFVILLWTVYSHWVYDRFINDKVEGAVKNRGMYVMTEEERRAKREKNMLSKNIRFNNPAYINKQISSIDEGTTFTPLEPTFSRGDLERLAEEKAIVKKEIDSEFGDVEDEVKPEPVKEKEKEKVNNQQQDNALIPKQTKSKASFKINRKK